MHIDTTDLDGVVVLSATAHHDDRGFFVRTFETEAARGAGIDLGPVAQDSQSRSRRGVVRGMHGRSGAGEAKLVRCARGAVWDVQVDIRPGSPTFGRWQSVLLDDETFRHVYIPAGFLHGFQVLTEVADVCYRIDREHDPSEDLAVHHADPDLAIAWPDPVRTTSARDAAAPSWQHLVSELR